MTGEKFVDYEVNKTDEERLWIKTVGTRQLNKRDAIYRSR